VVREAQRELLLMTYSARPHQPLTEALSAAIGRGVKVSVVVETLQGAGGALSGDEPYQAFELAAALAERGVACRRGDVLLACDGSQEPAVLAQVRHLGLECQLVRNRGALMVLPSGVSKGAGLAAGLAELGTERAHSRRWRIGLGHLPDGSPVSIPASGVNVLVAGTPQQGKSYLAGLIAERLIRLGYSVVVIDPEGDHGGLRRLPGVMITGAGGRLLAADDLARLVRQHPGGVVVDLSAAPPEGRARYLSDVNRELEALRVQTGLPRSIILDEAQVPLAKDTDTIFESATTGYCMVTYRPGELRPEALLAIDMVIVLPEGTAASHTADLLAATATMPHAAAAALIRQAAPGQAVLAERYHPGAGQLFTIGHRETAHMRHWHKYSTGQLSGARRFYFRRDPATATGSTVGSAPELARELTSCEDQVISHHCWHGDFSRWVRDVLGDPPLAAAIAHAEQQARSGASPASTRTALIDAIRARYPQ